MVTWALPAFQILRPMDTLKFEKDHTNVKILSTLTFLVPDDIVDARPRSASGAGYLPVVC